MRLKRAEMERIESAPLEVRKLEILSDVYMRQSAVEYVLDAAVQCQMAGERTRTSKAGSADEK